MPLPEKDESTPGGGAVSYEILMFVPIKTPVNSMKLVILLHSLYWSSHTKDESKRGTAFAFIFGVN